MSKSDRLLWTALAVSTAAHVSLFWTPDLGWALDPPITTRDIAFLLDNMTPAGSRAPAGDPDQVERGAGVSPAPPAPPASPASPETGQAETPAPRGAGVPPAPPAPAGGPISDDPAAQGRLKALEEAAKVWDLDRPDAEGPRRRYVDQVRDKISAQYFIPEAARRQKMKGLVRLQAEVRQGVVDFETLRLNIPIKY
ncbi:MAG: hypothetical protein HYY93_01775 [Planctomycetes bacterium]|nr:hypothetical protein [Planctomycetota bacterium]